MDKAKKIHLANNKIKRIQEEMLSCEFIGDDVRYEELESQLANAMDKLEREKLK